MKPGTRKRIVGLSPSQRQLLQRRLAERRGGVEPRPDDEPVRLSSAQQRLWMLDRLTPGSSAFNAGRLLTLAGDLDLDVLRAGIDEIVARHEVLRTRVAGGSEGLAVVDPPRPVPVEIVDLSDEPSDQMEAATDAALRSFLRVPFRLEDDLLIRAAVVRRGPRDHVLALCTHHMASDDTSRAILLRELGQLYTAGVTGADAALEPVQLQYGDYARWQHRQRDDQRIADEIEWWVEQLADAPTSLDLPTDHPRPTLQSNAGARLRRSLPPEVAGRLQDMCRGEGVTFIMGVLAVFAAVLARYANQEDIVVGTPVSVRHAADIEAVMGMFTNNLTLRVDLSGDPTFTELLHRVQWVLIDAVAHQEAPFEQVVEAVQPPRDLSRPPVFQVMINSVRRTKSTEAWGPLEVSPRELDAGTCQVDLALVVEEHETGSELLWEWCTDLFDEATVVRLAQHLAVMASAVTDDPSRRLSQIDLLTREERQRVLVEWNPPATPVPAGAVHELIAARCQLQPTAVAVVAADGQLTYAELDERANRLARLLRDKGVGPGSLVGVCLDRTLDLVPSLLAVLKAGAAYVPLDPEYPTTRLDHMLTDSGASTVITVTPFAAALAHESRELLLLDERRAELQAGPAAAPDRPSAATDLAYVIYTSGSSGTPKGVMIEHGALTNFVTSMAEQPGVGPDDVLVAVTTPCFDIAGLELFLPLVEGGRVVIASREATGDAVVLARLLDDVGATVMQATPATWELLLESGWPGRPQLRALCGGEALSPALAAALANCVGELWNMFGPTETTIWSMTTRVLPTAGSAVPIGRPIANTTCYVLDSAGRPAPIGVPGELYIGGAGLARGYINLPDLTAELFVENPLPDRNGRLYRTGDTVRWRPDGQLEFFGRSDDQIKLHGFRIELGEVEAALRRLPEVARAVAAVREDGGNRRLVAYVVPAAGQKPSSTEVLRALAEVLPAHMVPAQVVVLDALPLTLNGKVDRRSLPAPASVTGPTDEPLGTDAEARMAELWSSLLGTPVHSQRAHFFEVGGHSLVATKLVARLREDLGVDVPLKAIFERPMLADIAALVAELAAGSPDRSPSIDLVRRNRDHHRIDAADVGDPDALARARAGTPGGAGAASGNLVVFPMSFAQEGLWVLEQLDPGRSLYNIPIVRRIVGEVDADALERAFLQLVERHESLRTGLVDAGGVLAQVVHPSVEVSLERRTTAGATDPWAAAVAETTAFGLQPFPLDRPPLIRARLTTTGTTEDGEPESLLCITAHHAVIDGWAIETLMGELAALYNGHEDPLPDDRLDYGDYVVWQRSDAQQAKCAAQLEYWRRELEEAPPLVDLPTDRPRPALQSHRGARLLRSLDTAATSALRSLTASAGSTVFSVGLAAWSVVLSRHSGEADIVIGTPVAGRTRPALEPVVGLFTNTVPLRLQIDDRAPFPTHVDRTSAVIATALAHQDLPFDRLVDEVCTHRDLSRHPIYNVMATMQTPDRLPQLLGSAEVQAEGIDWGWARFVDLSLTYIDSGSSIDVSLEYSSDLFDADTAERLVAHVERVLVAADAEPTSPVQDLDIVAADERVRLLEEWNTIGRDRPQPQDMTIVDLFEAQVRAAPDAVALRFGDTVHTYAELDRRANRLAHRLVREGVAAESLVGVAMDRSAPAIVALLAVLKAGGAYVPLDPAYPEDRLQFILDDAEIEVVVADRASAEGVPLAGRRVVWVDDASLLDEQETVPPRSVGPGNAAYVIYTSGSTGTPKGVVIEHRSIVRLVFKPNWLPDLDRPVIAQLATIAFDASTFEIWLPLAHGGTIVGIDREVALSADDFARDLAAEGIEVLFITTALFNETVLRRADAFASLGTVLVGGEALNVRRIREVLDSHPPDRLLNVYGPTECTTFATTYVIERGDTDRSTIPIGAGITDTTCYVLDPNLRPVPVGVPGELYLGGGGVARGYLRRPALTTERFLPDPFTADEVMYRTGDRVRWLPTGAIEFLGRYDNQVKIRGFRIELGEVEAALRSHDGVQDAVVVVRDDLADGRRLVAYVTPSGGADAADATEVRAHVRGRLPDYMVPSYVVPVDEIPVTRNGKLDRAALPAPDVEGGARAFTGPRSPIEELVANAWSTVLGLSRVDVLSDFYDLGGESLSATRVISLIRDEGVTVPLRVMFDEPTVAAVARWILEDLTDGLSDDLTELGV